MPPFCGGGGGATAQQAQKRESGEEAREFLRAKLLAVKQPPPPHHTKPSLGVAVKQPPPTQLRMRREEAEELWGEFREVISALYRVPGLAAKMEAKLNKAFIEAAVSSRSKLKGWLDQFVKAGRLRLETMDREGGEVEFAAAWCGFLMLLPGEYVPSEEFEADSPATKGRGKRSAASKAQAYPCAQGDSAARAKAGSASAKQDPSHKAPRRMAKCPHGSQRNRCKDCGGASICQHNRIRSKCIDCGGASTYQHRRERSKCIDCGGSQICQHQRQRSICKDCGGASIWQHNRIRSKCIDYGGASICEHKRVRSECIDCGGPAVCVKRRRIKSRCVFCPQARKCAQNTRGSYIAGMAGSAANARNWHWLAGGSTLYTTVMARSKATFTRTRRLRRALQGARKRQMCALECSRAGGHC